MLERRLVSRVVPEEEVSGWAPVELLFMGGRLEWVVLDSEELSA